jgi:hypothetical protein
MKGKFYGTINREGRKPNVPNKLNKEIRQSFLDLLKNNAEQMQSDLDELQPRERLIILIQLAKIILPPPTPTEQGTENIFTPVQINFSNDNK